MTWTHVQGATGSPVTSGFTATAAYGSNVTAGNLLVAVVTRNAGYNNSPTVQTVTDNQGNKWKQARESVDNVLGTFGADVWYCDRAIGGAAPTVTATLAKFPSSPISLMMVAVTEYSCGTPGYERLETGGTKPIDATTGAVATLDSCSAHDLLITVGTGNGSAAVAPSGWASRVNDATHHMFTADLVDSGAAGVKSAAWTGMTGRSAGVGLIVAFSQAGTQPSTGVRCEQMQYWAPGLGSGPDSLTIVSPAFNVLPAAGSTLIVNINVNGGCAVASVADDQGNAWTRIAAQGFDSVGGINTSMWACKGTWAAPPTLTAIAVGSPNFPNGPPGGLAAWTMFEYVNLGGIHVNATGTNLMFPATAAPTVSTTTPTNAGDLVLAYINSQTATFDGLSGIPAWRNRLNDSNGSGGLIELVTPPPVVQTAGWTYSNSQGGSAYMVAVGTPPVTAGVLIDPRNQAAGMWGASDPWIAALQGGNAARVTYADLTTPDNATAMRLHVTDGDCGLALTDAVRRDLTATIIDPTGALTPTTANDLLTPYVTEVTVRSGWRFSDGTEELSPVGVFRITLLTVNDLGFGTQLDVTGQDRSSVVKGNSAAPISIPPGTNAIDAIQRLVKARYPAATFTAALSSYVLPPLFYPANTDLWAAAQKIGATCGLDVAFGPTGSCVIRPTPSISAGSPVTLTYGDGGLPMWAAQHAQAAADTPNGVIMEGTHSTLPTPVRGEAWVTDPDSPIRKDGPYGEQPVFVSSASISTADQASAAAMAQLVGLLGSADTVTFSTVPNARVDAGDIIAINRPALSEAGQEWIVTAATIPWAAGTAMQVTAKRQLVVATS